MFKPNPNSPSLIANSDASACDSGCGSPTTSGALPTPCGPARVSRRELMLRDVADRFKLDQALVSEVLSCRPRGLIPLVTPFGCYSLERSQPEKTSFGIAWDPILRLMLGGISTPDQELTVTSTQGVGVIPTPATACRTRVTPERMASYPVIGCRIYFATTAQQSPINSAETVWTVAPWNYNANGTTLRVRQQDVGGVLEGLDTEDVYYRGNSQRFSMGAQQTGGAYVFFAARRLSAALEPDVGEGQSAVDVTVPIDAMIRGQSPPAEGDGVTTRSPYAPLYIEALTSGLVTGAQISQNVTVLAPGQPYLEEAVARLLELYYEPHSVSLNA